MVDFPGTPITLILHSSGPSVPLHQSQRLLDCSSIAILLVPTPSALMGQAWGTRVTVAHIIHKSYLKLSKINKGATNIDSCQNSTKKRATNLCYTLHYMLAQRWIVGSITQHRISRPLVIIMAMRLLSLLSSRVKWTSSRHLEQQAHLVAPSLRLWRWNRRRRRNWWVWTSKGSIRALLGQEELRHQGLQSFRQRDSRKTNSTALESWYQTRASEHIRS